MDELQKERLLKSKNFIEKIKSKLTIINLLLFGLSLLLIIVGGSAINLSTRYDSMNIGFWKISELAKEAKNTSGLEQLASNLSGLAFFTIVLLVVSALGVVSNIVWRTWKDKKFNTVKYVVAIVFFAVVFIMFFMIISLNTVSGAAILPGWAFWVNFVCGIIAGCLNLMVFLVEKQVAKIEINE